MGKGLTFTVIFKAMSLNYGESLGNISELKKLNFGENTYTYISRQALRYELYKCMTQNYGMDSGKVSPLSTDQKVVQFKAETNAAEYVEADLFGYMKTEKGKGSVIRPAVVRITPAIALEPFMNDIEFGTNKNFADRAGKDPDPFQFEHHRSLYTYTIAIDLDRVGVDENDGEEVEKDEKINRVSMILNAVQILNREIKGRIENLNPLFVIGGLFSVKNPFFLGRIKISYDKDNKAYAINTNILKSVLDQEYTINQQNEKVGDNTDIGFVSGYWANEDELQELTSNKDKSIKHFFNNLKNKVKEYYEAT